MLTHKAYISIKYGAITIIIPATAVNAIPTLYANKSGNFGETLINSESKRNTPNTRIDSGMQSINLDLISNSIEPIKIARIEITIFCAFEICKLLVR